MKFHAKPILFGASLLALTLSCTAAVATQDTASPDAPPPPPAHAGEQGHGKKKHHEGRGDRLEAMAQHLNLTEAQKIQLKPLMQEQKKAMKAIRGDDTLSPEQRHAKIKAVREEYRPKIHAVLTPDQISKLGNWEKKARKRDGHGPTPPPPPAPGQPVS